ncbi:MAG: hypothetical protein ABJO97_06510 [Roseibium sp.]|uniref:hypothetical protein n=1 Tax=Alphaproteobacteria TaxID=28211 RepID=UPI0032968A20
MTAARKSEFSKGVTIEYSAETMVEHLSRTIPPVGDVSADAFAVVQRPLADSDSQEDAAGSCVEVVTARLDAVSKTGKLVHIRPDLQSSTGYQLHEADLPALRWLDGTPVPLQEVDRIDAFYQTQRTQDGRIVPAINTIVQFQRDDDPSLLFVLPMQFTDEDGWHPWALARLDERPVRNHLDRVRQIAVFRGKDGRHILHGISADPGGRREDDRMFLIYQNRHGEWRESNNEMWPDRISELRLLPGGAGETARIATRNANEMFIWPVTIDDETLKVDEETSVPLSGLDGQISGDRLLPMPARVGDRGVLLHDRESGNLSYLTGYQGDAELSALGLTGGAGQPSSIKSVATGRDATNNLVVFATDADTRMWVLRQKADSGAHGLDFEDWICLGEEAVAVGAPRAMLSGPECFIVTKERQVKRISQCVENSLWAYDTLAVPRQDSDPVDATRCHLARLVVKNAKNSPAPFARVEIQSSHPVVAYIGQYAHLLTPSKGVLAEADATGVVRVRLPADRLTAPKLHVRPSDSDTWTEVQPDVRTMPRLSGAMKGATSATLIEAGILPQGLSHDEAAKLTDLYRDVSGSLANGLGKTDPRSRTGDKVQTFEVGVNDNQQISTTVRNWDLSNPLEFLQDAISTAGEFFKQIGKRLGDFLLQVRNKVVDVARLVVSTIRASGDIRINFTIGGHTVDLHFRAADALDAVESLIGSISNLLDKAGKAIKNAADAVLGFLAEKLGWAGIMRANDVLRAFALKGLDGLATILGDKAVTWTQDLFSQISAFADHMGTQLSSLLPPELAEKSTGAQGRAERDGIASPAELMRMLASDDPALNTVMDAVHAAWEVVTKFMTDLKQDVLSPASRELVESLEGLLEETAKAFWEGINLPIQRYLKEYGNPDPRDLKSLLGVIPSIFSSLPEVARLAIDKTEAIIVAILRVAAAAVRCMKEILTAPFSGIPFIGEVFKIFSLDGRGVDLLDVLTLPTAAAGSILNKVVTGKDLITVEARDAIVNPAFQFGDIFKCLFSLGQTSRAHEASIRIANDPEPKSVGAAANPVDEKSFADGDAAESEIQKANDGGSGSSINKIVAMLQPITGTVAVMALDLVLKFVENKFAILKQADAAEPAGNPSAVAFFCTSVIRILRAVLRIPASVFSIVAFIKDLNQFGAHPTYKLAGITIASAVAMMIVFDCLYHFAQAIVFLGGLSMPGVAMCIARFIEIVETASKAMMLFLGAIALTVAGFLVIGRQWDSIKTSLIDFAKGGVKVVQLAIMIPKVTQAISKIAGKIGEILKKVFMKMLSAIVEMIFRYLGDISLDASACLNTISTVSTSGGATAAGVGALVGLAITAVLVVVVIAAALIGIVICIALWLWGTVVKAIGLFHDEEIAASSTG